MKRIQEKAAVVDLSCLRRCECPPDYRDRVVPIGASRFLAQCPNRTIPGRYYGHVELWSAGVLVARPCSDPGSLEYNQDGVVIHSDSEELMQRQVMLSAMRTIERV